MTAPTAMLIASLWNLAVFCTYGFDKHRSRRGGRRVSERTLLLLAVAAGFAGALAGMFVFRHKTRKPGFVLAVAGITVAWGAVGYWWTTR